jgi:hypothetical protein
MFTTINQSVYTDIAKTYSSTIAKAASDFAGQLYSANQSLASEYAKLANSAEMKKFAQPAQEFASSVTKTYLDVTSNLVKAFTATK